MLRCISDFSPKSTGRTNQFKLLRWQRKNRICVTYSQKICFMCVQFWPGYWVLLNFSTNMMHGLVNLEAFLSALQTKIVYRVGRVATTNAVLHFNLCH